MRTRCSLGHRGFFCAMATAAPASTKWPPRPALLPAPFTSASKTRQTCSSRSPLVGRARHGPARDRRSGPPQQALMAMGRAITDRARDHGGVIQNFGDGGPSVSRARGKNADSTKARIDDAVANYFRGQMRRRTLCLSDPDRAAVLFLQMVCAELRECCVRIARGAGQAGLRRASQPCHRDFFKRHAAACRCPGPRFVFRMIHKSTPALSILVATSLSACAVGPNYKPPAAPPGPGFVGPAPYRLPPRRRRLPAGGAALRGWTGHPRAVVDAVPIGAAQCAHRARDANSPALEAAQAALREANENVAAERGSYFPSVSGSYQAERARSSAAPRPVRSLDAARRGSGPIPWTRSAARGGKSRRCRPKLTMSNSRWKPRISVLPQHRDRGRQRGVVAGTGRGDEDIAHSEQM